MPRICAGCKEDLSAPLSGPLCGVCLQTLAVLNGPLCRRCGIEVKDGRGHCRLCQKQIFALDCIRAAFPYRGPLPALLYAFKYRKRRDIGEVLAGWMAGVFPRLQEFHGIEGIVPVPLHPAREGERGFNQAAVLADGVAHIARTPVLNVLVRTRNTIPQWQLGKSKRAENLQGAFQARPEISLKGLSLLLIDDVCATGGTLEQCALALQGAGAASLRAFVLARD